MRGNHSEYIAMCNAHCGVWYEPHGRRGHVRSIAPMVYYLPDGRMEIPAGTTSDLFSVVPDTSYLEFHKAAFLHDWQRRRGVVSRAVADYNFAWDMGQRIQHIRRILIDCQCPARVVDREAIRLTRLAAMYSLGVSGLIGSAYIALDRWF